MCHRVSSLHAHQTVHAKSMRKCCIASRTWSSGLRQVNPRVQSSQIVSKSRSCLLSAPQTLHLFLFSLALPKPNPWPFPLPGTSRLPLRNPRPRVGSPSLFSSSDPDLARSSEPTRRSSSRRFSSSRAAASASGVSGIVSREEIEGERERAEVGVLGMEDEEKLRG
jgi:hypothetical protein